MQGPWTEADNLGQWLGSHIGAVPSRLQPRPGTLTFETQTKWLSQPVFCVLTLTRSCYDNGAYLALPRRPRSDLLRFMRVPCEDRPGAGYCWLRKHAAGHNHDT